MRHGDEKSTESKEDKDEKIKMFKKKVAEHDAAIKKLIKAITENNDKAADITKYMEKETGLRDENHAEIVATIKDSQDAQAAVKDRVGGSRLHSSSKAAWLLASQEHHVDNFGFVCMFAIMSQEVCQIACFEKLY